ncbi:hypothetical protein F0562_005114 [Nyssa sinensis]|uniref:Pentatricopeptide repeat-containing protein n=1 Tax=Nyssa sinensis TaxID=561372 RepID=A0A5J5AH59_9ASTE|nr:hypothetical protein F0562_005114 [Nyssa sinensis]
MLFLGRQWFRVIAKPGIWRQQEVLFDKMPVKNLVPWTIIISGYAEKGIAKEAISLYDQMEKTGLKPDDGTILKYFSCLRGVWFACIGLNTALTIFNGMKKRDLVSWNAMIQGLAMHGHGKKALQLFSIMKQEGFVPDKVTFVGVLCACTHAGFVNEGLQYFHTMERDYGLVPEIEHYGCMIDLLGRGGRLMEAFRLVHSMPLEPNAIIWGTLLRACRMHNAVEPARKVLDQLVKLEPNDTGNFSMLSNIYAAAGDWDSVANVRLQMKNIGTQKSAGASSIELDDEFHEFTVLDRSHPKSDRIYQMIDILMRAP